MSYVRMFNHKMSVTFTYMKLCMNPERRPVYLNKTQIHF